MRRLVLATPASLLVELGYFQGLTRDIARYAPLFAKALFVDREQAETDPTLKQLIPYVILRHGSRVFSYIRGREASEGRLVALMSIGLGGHIEPFDDSIFRAPDEMYLEAARREVEEEVEVRAHFDAKVVGLINDDANEVGRVHLGVVCEWSLDAPRVAKRERQITQARFRDVATLRVQSERLEPWSRIALDTLG